MSVAGSDGDASGLLLVNPRPLEFMTEKPVNFLAYLLN